MNDEIIITKAINADQRKQVARLYLDAFPKKFDALWLFSRSEKRAVPALAAALNAHEGLYAVREGRLIGFIGLETGSRFYAHLTYDALRQGFCFFGALWRRAAYAVFRLFHGQTDSDSLHIDPIVVSEQARGSGVGSRLIDSAIEYGKRLNKSRITLEVVDTNPDAQRLYERKGFSVVRVQDLGLLASGSGFRRVSHMERPLQISGCNDGNASHAAVV